MTQNVLSVNALKSGYKSNFVVNDVTFDIQKGEIFGLVGLNGAGKTTLIKTILGLKKLHGGSINHADSSSIAYLPEKFEPPHFLTGRQFIDFTLRLYGQKIEYRELQEQAELLSFNTAFLNKNVSQYSKGMKQKIGLLATVLSNSTLTILDEPMSGLDPKARREIKEMILLLKKRGKSIFMSSHILTDITELCDRIAVFHDSQLQFVGAPDDFIDKGRSHNPEQAFLNIINS